jgi:regulator of sigma E protease
LDFCLIAAASSLDAWLGILQVAIGLGMVIFVHELGHFVVAKLCGVKCEKFYLGFDIGGWKFCKFTYGETEYGIGILPLGGYVKMLGQEDNPARLREEIERAKLKASESAPAAVASAAESESADDGPLANPAASDGPADAPTAAHDTECRAKLDAAAAEAALYDPRSYLAQSVPKRMAIISAGVIMNLVFAFFMAVVAYKIGVKEEACGVGQVIPGREAWQKGFQPGDRVIEIAGKKASLFQDLQAGISLGDIKGGIPIVVERPGVPEPIEFIAKPDNTGGMPMLGITNPLTTTLDADLPATPGSAAAEATPPFEKGDTIVAIDGTPIGDYAQLNSYLVLHPSGTLKVTVERTERSPENKKEPVAREVTVEVGPNPMQRLGLVMEMGKIVAIQEDSPAAKAGIRAGDRLLEIDGQSPGDPMTLPDRLQGRAGQTVVLSIEPKGKGKAVDVPVVLRDATWRAPPLAAGDPVSVPALGIAYAVRARVESVIPGSPAAEAGLAPGDLITEATIIPPPEEAWPKNLPIEPRKVPVSFGEDKPNWPSFLYLLQDILPGSQIELSWLTAAKEEKKSLLAPAADENWLNPDRGLRLEPELVDRVAGSWGQAVDWGWSKTVDYTLLVYRFLEKLGSQISPKHLGGPISIFIVAKREAAKGPGKLLLFLTLLSANLAVINFLPIPVLDGGHMVLLAYEGIRGKPADERVLNVVTWAGLIFVLTLMLWVIGLDIVRLITGAY